MSPKLPSGFKTRKEYNAYMRTYKQKRGQDVSLLLDFFREENEFHVFIGERPLSIYTMAPHGLETFLKMASPAGLDTKKMRHYHVKLVER